MIKYLPIIFLFLSGVTVHAQNILNYSEIKLETETDYKNAEKHILEAADYILSTPFDADDMKRTEAIQFILAWMEGADGYDFDLSYLDKLDNEVTQKTTYLTSLVKYMLENKEKAYDKATIEQGVLGIFFAYCENPQNNIKQTRKLKKLAKEYKRAR